jgi:hypothetical protein
MQKIIFYNRVTGELLDHDTGYYKSESNYIINPLEDIIVILQNHGFGKDVMLPLSFHNNRFTYLESNPLSQIVFWVRNLSPSKTLFVYSNSTLTDLLNQPKVIFHLATISVHDLYQFNSQQHEFDSSLGSEISENSESSESTSSENRNNQ